LTRKLAAATGATGGVIVSWVDPEGPAAGALQIGDVIEEADGERLTSQQWAVRAARLVPGTTLTVRARRGGAMHEVSLVAASPQPQPGITSLGLTMRALPGVGSEVTRVAPLTAAHRAGMEAGDVITLAGTTAAPAPAQVREAFAAYPEGQGVLVGVTRGTSHRVVVVGP
jgi:S1-C subfamily serine protease